MSQRSVTRPRLSDRARAVLLRRRRADVRAPIGPSAIWRAVRIPRSTVALLAISIVLPLVLFGLAAAQNRAEVLEAAEHRVERTTRILHEHALKIFETHRLMIDQINERLRTVDWSSAADRAALHTMLAHLQALLPEVADIQVTGPDGFVRADSLRYPVPPGIDLADRDYFKALKAADQALPYVSSARSPGSTGEPVFNMASRAAGPGSDRQAFNGVVAIAVDPSYFGDFYRDIEREYRHVVILARDDGSVLASEPPMATSKLPSNTLFRLAIESKGDGATVHPTTIGGVPRIFGDEKVGPYPVMVGFGVSRAAALRPWCRNMWGYGLVAGLSSLALLGVSGFAIRRIALEGRATVRWRRSAALLEAEIAEREAVEEKLRQSQKMEAVGRLTGGIAHDFNNLLTVVIGSLDMLGRRMKDADPRHRTLVDNAVDGATRAAALTARLLAFSRQQPLEPKPLDANALIEGMSHLLARTLGERVSIDLTLAESLPHAFADPNQLESAILNLCVNAVDAMPLGGRLTVRTSSVGLTEEDCSRRDGLRPGRYVAVAIEDTGTGMTPEVVAHAFEPFFTTKPVGKGTGLGLSQVYGFARQSGGHAEIASALGQGTTISIFLPHAVAGAGTRPDEEREPSPNGRGAPYVEASGHRTILVVEDDDLVRQFSCTALREAGYRVLEAATGPDGLRILRTHGEVDLLFTDVVLKGPLNGWEVAEQAQGERPDLPVLFTTGYTPETVIQSAGRLDGGVTLLPKPFSAAALTMRVAALLPGDAVEDVRHLAVG